MPHSGAGLVLLARHGRTLLNVQGRLRGRLDPPLDAVGRAEADRLGAALAGYRPSRLLASPLRRARQTAEAVAERSGVTVEVDERLADRDYGPASGLTLTEIEQRWGGLETVPGVEPTTRVAERALAVLHDVRTAAPRAATGGSTEAVVVVAHDAVNRAVLAALLPSPTNRQHVTQRTACWNVLVAGPDSWRVERIDVVAPPDEAHSFPPG